MKKYILTITIIFASLLAIAQNKVITKSIAVKGNCGQCKERIEEAVYKIKGVKSAEWNKKTQILTVVFVSSKTNIETIEKSVAAVGHDASTAKASAEVYKTLPGCCKYREGNTCKD